MVRESRHAQTSTVQGAKRPGRTAGVANVMATCEGCGDVELNASQIVVRVCLDNDTGSYAFPCPRCGMAVAKLAEAKVVELLVATGSRLDVWRLPTELKEAHTGPVLTHDDLLAFHYELQEPGWLDRFVAQAKSASTVSEDPPEI